MIEDSKLTEIFVLAVVFSRSFGERLSSRFYNFTGQLVNGVLQDSGENKIFLAFYQQKIILQYIYVESVSQLVVRERFLNV